MRGLFWWVDQWRASSAYGDLDLECQGAYRNLLDEACLRGGAIPNRPEVLARACGDSRRWPDIGPIVLTRFRLVDSEWRNDTLDGVMQESERRAASQRDFRASSGNPVASAAVRRTREAARGAARRAVAAANLSGNRAKCADRTWSKSITTITTNR